MANLNIEQKKVKSLFQESKYNFLIPDYQRPYAWGEMECKTLWDDLFSFSFPNDDCDQFVDDEEYFLGPIVTFKNRNQMEVIDGQQRLTTLMLLLRAFYNKLGSMKDSRSKRMKEDIEKCIWRANEFGEFETSALKDMEPMVYVNYCEKSEFMNPRCQKLSDLNSQTAEQDKAWYAERNPKTNEPTTTAQMFVTVYYAEKGDQMLHHFKGKIDIGTGNGGLLSQLKLQNEMRLTDESWINYQKGKGNEEFQKYMEDLTDMQNHVLPYLQSFCSLEERGVQERREQLVADKKESRSTAVIGAEKQANVKEAGKVERKSVPQKKAAVGKEKKPSIHERLEINKKIIQEKQGKDKPERGADLGVRTV